MKTLVIALIALPFLGGLAVGKPQPLSDQQMDKVTAGVTVGTGGNVAIAIADAQGLVGALQTILTTTSALAKAGPVATATQGGTTSTLFSASSASQSSSVTSTTSPGPIPGP